MEQKTKQDLAFTPCFSSFKKIVLQILAVH